MHRLHVAVLYGGHAVVPGHDDRTRRCGSLGKGTLAQMKLGMGEHIVRVLGVQGGGARRHGLGGRGQRREGLDLCVHQPGGARSTHAVARNHDRNLIAPHADMRVEQLAVADVLMGRNGRPGVSGGRELNVGHVETGENAHDARDGLGLG